MDYLNINDNDKKELETIFSKWFDWFINKTNVNPTDEVYTDESGKTYTVSDFMAGVKAVFGFQSPCKEYLTAAFEREGREAVLEFMERMMPLVIRFSAKAEL